MNRRKILTTLLSTATLFAAASCAATPLPPRPPLRDRLAGYELTVLIDGVPAETFQHDGGTYVLGELGARYTLRVANRSGRRVEAVVSIDGRDVVDGKPGDFRSNRGYMIPAWGSVDIDGWRISRDQAAAFRFSPVPHSYAARMGDAREVGVIGVALFPEQVLPPPPAPALAPREQLVPRREIDDQSLGELDSGAAPAPSARGAGRPAKAARGLADRPGLGTEYGEAVSSRITEVEFVRANATRPAAVLGVRYNDRRGLLAMGIAVDGDARLSDAELRRSADPFPLAERRYAPAPAGWTPGCGSRCSCDGR